MRRLTRNVTSLLLCSAFGLPTMSLPVRAETCSCCKTVPVVAKKPTVQTIALAKKTPMQSVKKAPKAAAKSNPKQDMALLQAAATGNTIGVRQALANGANIETHDGQYGFTPLMWAAWRGHIGSLRELLKRGANANAASLGDGTRIIVLHEWTGRSDAPAELDFFTRNRGITPLMLGAANGSAITIRELLKAGANPQARNIVGETALEIAAYQGYLPAVQAILAAGADVNAIDKDGSTPLIGAVVAGHKPVIEELLKRGADATYRDRLTRLTSTQAAYILGYHDLVPLLNRAAKKQLAKRPRTAAKNAFQKKPVSNRLPAREAVRIISSDGRVDFVR